MEIQEYQLKIGIVCTEQLQISDLVDYLHLQLNEYLSTEVRKIAKGSKSNERFSAVLQPLLEGGLEQQEYVGFVFIYNNVNFDSLQYVRRQLSEMGLRGTEETFLLIAELQGKALNIAQQEGTLLAKKYEGKFLKLSYQNSEEIVTMIKSYVHAMIQNYYFPQQVIQEEDAEEQNTHYELNYVAKNVDLTEEQENRIQQILKDTSSDQPYLLQMSRRNFDQKNLLQETQKDIDENIGNLEKVLRNMDAHIKSRVDNDWFRSLKRTIYSKVEKESTRYSRVKLTQHFLNENQEDPRTRVPLQTVVPKKRGNLLMKLRLSIGSGKSVQVQVFQDSQYVQLAKQALRKIGVPISDNSLENVQSRIQLTVGQFVQELTESIKSIQKQKINNRRFLIN